MTRNEAKSYLKQEILSVLNESAPLREATDNDYETIAQELEALAEKADEMGDTTLAKQIRNQVSYSNKEAVKLAGGGQSEPSMDMGMDMGDEDLDMDMDMGDGEDFEDLDIEDVEIEDEPKNKDNKPKNKNDKKKKKVKEALRQEILRTLK